MNPNQVFNITDTETTGFSHMDGDRIIEIGIIKIQGIHPVDQFHVLINPMRDIPAAATDVHGITAEMVRGKPTFEQVADEFLAFIGEDPLVIHNAPFDIGFLNAELTLAKKKRLGNTVHDTLDMARRKFPGSPATLDALNRRFSLPDLRKQGGGYHGALIDAKMLAKIFIELQGGRQSALTLGSETKSAIQSPVISITEGRRGRVIAATPDEIAAHDAFLKANVKNPIWSAA